MGNVRIAAVAASPMLMGMGTFAMNRRSMTPKNQVSISEPGASIRAAGCLHPRQQEDPDVEGGQKNRRRRAREICRTGERAPPMRQLISVPFQSMMSTNTTPSAPPGRRGPTDERGQALVDDENEHVVAAAVTAPPGARPDEQIARQLLGPRQAPPA